MRSRSANWFECKIRYEKVMEDGLQKKVTENYVVDALSFSEAEERITEEMSSYISGEFDVADIKKASYGETGPNCSSSPTMRRRTRRSAAA